MSNDADNRCAVDSFVLIDRLLICFEVNDWWELVPRHYDLHSYRRLSFRARLVSHSHSELDKVISQCYCRWCYKALCHIMGL